MAKQLLNGLVNDLNLVQPLDWVSVRGSLDAGVAVVVAVVGSKPVVVLVEAVAGVNIAARMISSCCYCVSMLLRQYCCCNCCSCNCSCNCKLLENYEVAEVWST